MFFEHFLTVRVNDSEEYVVTNVTPKTLTGKVALQVNGNINQAAKIELCFTIRNKRYILNLI